MPLPGMRLSDLFLILLIVRTSLITGQISSSQVTQDLDEMQRGYTQMMSLIPSTTAKVMDLSCRVAINCCPNNFNYFLTMNILKICFTSTDESAIVNCSLAMELQQLFAQQPVEELEQVFTHMKFFHYTAAVPVANLTSQHCTPQQQAALEPCNTFGPDPRIPECLRTAFRIWAVDDPQKYQEYFEWFKKTATQLNEYFYNTGSKNPIKFRGPQPSLIQKKFLAFFVWKISFPDAS
ncbi:unnamed protein product [Didymodactylos carnosus]|uniref:Uncharacterized protein n=1 Tax=Didymodactylos carnosus TaxID=1234261 RepID=A0A815DYW6_9BILA|nr:unnamed protein product [Didymodactylos carnosus]CAF1304451.1 unnamed protein product [Didymodactylos carnosus]CAF3680431.1 unnamed protein product [Didymodactylos carnosus]CAF4134497.1 unnamed protein product [Didymodactylos carnosus]